MVFDSNDFSTTCFCVRYDTFYIEWLDTERIEHAHVDLFAFQRLVRFQTLVQRYAGTYQKTCIAVALLHNLKIRKNIF